MSRTMFIRVFGPRTPKTLTPEERAGFLSPALLLAFAAALYLSSIFLPYWSMTLKAPQYPNGLHVVAHINRLDGDVKEIDGLNHYIGMRPLGDAAQLERSLSIVMVGAVTLLVVGAVFVHSPFAALLTLPAILFPIFFLLDLHFWLSAFGQNLDPHAPLSHAVKPFTPPVLGMGTVGQFRTVASPGAGLILAAVGSVLTLSGLFLQRMVYKSIRARLLRESEEIEA